MLNKQILIDLLVNFRATECPDCPNPLVERHICCRNFLETEAIICYTDAERPADEIIKSISGSEDLKGK
jgi:hypothetical protein